MLPTKSPTKKDKQAIEQKKLFDSTKQELASSFLEELDKTIAGGQLALLSQATGGIKIIWSKKLNSTAGRANWKREVIRNRNPDGSNVENTIRHHASIELAEKVIDDEDRLLNVVAHEFCHLANFMISNVKDQPHGASFKQWYLFTPRPLASDLGAKLTSPSRARKVTTTFTHKNITVTTKHSYAISYKYIWTCISCSQEYKRHSKSIDPARSCCGKCKGKLVKTQPVPRGSNKGGGSKGSNQEAGETYQSFVKKWYKTVKEESPSWTMGQITSELARRYRAEKEQSKRAAVEKGEEEDDKGRLKEVVVLDSEDDGCEEKDKEFRDLAKSLDSLRLEMSRY